MNRVFADGLTCDETLVLQLPEEHSDFVQVRQSRLGVLQHRPLLFLSGGEKEFKIRAAAHFWRYTDS